MNMQNFLFPSKTFLIGEYAVLKQAAALILCTEPDFYLHASESISASPKLIGIHPESPAGKLWNKYADFFKQFDITFQDPYAGIGGFGASSAQFLGLLALKMSMQHPMKIEQIINLYREIAWDGDGFPPSGADMIAQLYGGLCYFNPKDNKVLSYSWPFPHVDFCLLHTGNKVNTHEHLKTLNDFSIEDLATVTAQAIFALQNQDSEAFIQSIKDYSQILDKKQLVCDNTKILLHQINQLDGVLTCKGCGTLGADVILVLLSSSKLQPLLHWAEQNKLKIIHEGNAAAQSRLHLLY